MNAWHLGPPYAVLFNDFRTACLLFGQSRTCTVAEVILATANMVMTRGVSCRQAGALSFNSEKRKDTRVPDTIVHGVMGGGFKPPYFGLSCRARIVRASARQLVNGSSNVQALVANGRVGA